jgi:hypothetical protein
VARPHLPLPPLLPPLHRDRRHAHSQTHAEIHGAPVQAEGEKLKKAISYQLSAGTIKA